VSRRIDELADNVREQLIQKTKESDFIAIHFDESRDVSNLVQVPCFIKYISNIFVEEYVLFLQACVTTYNRTMSPICYFTLQAAIAWTGKMYSNI
jgi:hypothetical protein